MLNYLVLDLETASCACLYQLGIITVGQDLGCGSLSQPGVSCISVGR